jgi:hypothetical protein
MLEVYLCAMGILWTSIVLGWALLHLLGETRPIRLAGAVGFAALTVASPLLIRLPGRAATLAIVFPITLGAAFAYLFIQSSSPTARDDPAAYQGRAAFAVTVIVLAAASLPFLFNQRVGVLGEGVYTNDQAAQLYWTDWLQQGFGPEPSAVRFGYPTGPQAVAAVTAEVTGTSLEEAFNGLLLAIPVLTALAALSALGELPPVRRVIAASLTGLPYLAASFLAQSAFKETAMALLVLAFAVALGELARGASRRAWLIVLVLFAAASVFVYSLPGLAWFAIAVPVWLALEAVTGRLRVDPGELRLAARRHRRAIAIVAIVVVAVGALAAAQLSGFVGKVGEVQASAGRLSSPVFPGEALGVWPEGDFRIVRGDVGGAYPAVALGLLAAAIGGLAALRRRDWGLVAMGASAVAVYVGARLFASIYVEAKALAVMSPLVVLAALGALLAPARRTETGSTLTTARYALGAIVAAAFAASTFLALRAAPVGFDQRGDELESLAGLVQGRSVAFLGVDRFAGYWLRGTLVRSPGGYVPPEVKARPEKIWRQGRALDLDTLSPPRLDDFDYAITTRAAYQSRPPPNMERVTRTASYVLWKRTGSTPPLRVLNEDGAPGRVLDCSSAHGGRLAERAGTATVLAKPVAPGPSRWSRGSPFNAPASASQSLKLGPGRWQLSLQYHSQVALTVSAPGLDAELPPSLDGMYLTHQGQGAFWPAGDLTAAHGGALTVTVSAARPTALQRRLGVDRRVWLGTLAATRPGASQVPLSQACGRYVDHFVLGGGHNSGNR